MTLDELVTVLTQGGLGLAAAQALAQYLQELQSKVGAK